MTDSPKDELERLQKQRAELESRLADVKKDRETLEQKTIILRETAMVRELEEKLREEQNAVARLTFEKKELEDKMKGPNKFTVSEAIQRTKEKAEKEERKPETKKEREEETNVIWRKDGQTPENDEKPEAESKKPPKEEESKKKLRFF